jgi:dTDP-4-amino-4,6-dideoxygalactose transaminase
MDGYKSEFIYNNTLSLRYNVKIKRMKPLSLQMVDLAGQYNAIREEMNNAIQDVLNSCSFISGKPVGEFARNLAAHLRSKFVIPCGNGTDALQIAYMSLGLKPGDEIIVPSFTYIAPAEAAALLGLTPVFADSDPETFNLDCRKLDELVSPKTKAIVAVHLFGLSCNMEAVLAFAQKYNLYVIEDNAQSINASYRFSDGRTVACGTMGHIGCLSFFPSKNLGCYGDGGALLTQDAELAGRIKSIANHGQSQKYVHETIGCNSRLDTLQAAILNVKLNYLDKYTAARQLAAERYNRLLAGIPGLKTPQMPENQSSVYHQYTIQVEAGFRAGLLQFLADAAIPAMIYYPIPLHRQQAFDGRCRRAGSLAVSDNLSERVLSLPMHTELSESDQEYICQTIRNFYALS